MIFTSTILSWLDLSDLTHGLQAPNEVFFHRNPKLLSLNRQFGQISFGAFGVFSVDLSTNQLNIISTKKLSLYTQAPNIYFGIGI